LAVRHPLTEPKRVPTDNYSRWSHANLSNQKITLPLATHTKKTKLSEAMNSLAQKRINRALVADERPERFPNIVPQNQIGKVILVGRFPINDHQTRATILGHHGKTGGWPDHQ
jgi:hypothetical protein